MAKEKDDAAVLAKGSAANEVVVQGTPHVIQIVTPQPKPAEPVKDFDRTVPGGRYVVGGKLVDAHGKPIPDGSDRQDSGVLRESVQDAEDLSRLPVPNQGSGPAK
jgi:hypothetical protein